jgi:nucleoside-diphosphate-sugar epimerase
VIGGPALVFGAGGFIGSDLVRALFRADVDVHAVVRPSTDLWRLEGIGWQFSLHRLDVRDAVAVGDVVASVRPEVVFNLVVGRARPEDPVSRQESMDTSLLGARSLIEAVSRTRVRRVVHLGSHLEYAARDRALREDDPIAPGSFRGTVKATETAKWLHAARSRSISVTVLRPFHVYGPWETPSRLVPTAIRCAYSGRDMPIVDPVTRRDPVFVEDVVEACLLAATRELAVAQVFNVGSGQEWTTADIVDAVAEVTGRPIGLRRGAYPSHMGDNAHSRADITKAERLLGWRPRHRLREGLTRSVRWYLSRAGGRPAAAHDRAGAGAASGVRGVLNPVVD